MLSLVDRLSNAVTSVTMDVLPSNHQVLAMIASHWTAGRTDRSADCVTVHVQFPPSTNRTALVQPPALASYS